MAFTYDPQSRQNLDTVSYDYDYPIDEDLSPGSKLHTRLLDEVMERARESRRQMSVRYKEWRRIDRSLRAYVPPEWREDDEDTSTKRRGSGKTKREFVMPVSYANLETLLTYMSAAFWNDPLFSYEGTGPEDVLGAELLTKVISQQVTRTKVPLALHTMWRDSFAYGLGATSPQWQRKMGRRTETEAVGIFSQLRNLFVRTEQRRTTSDYKVLWEGNKLVNIDPYLYLPDPTVSANEVENAEYVGWVDQTSWKQLMNREKDPQDYVFNAKYVRHIDGTSRLSHEYQPGRGEDTRRNRRRTTVNDPVDVIWLYVDLIPEDWELGKGEYPEKWLFGVAGDDVVIAAQPLGLHHSEFPVAVAAPDYDGYSSAPASRLGIISDLQEIVDFLYNSHVQNVKKAVNNQWLVDPYLVNINDVNDPKPGKIMRMRRSAWGRGNIDAAMKQFEVQDVTRSHVGDAQILEQNMNNVTGATDVTRGIIPPRSSRISSQEIQGARQSSLSRMEKTARIIDSQAHQSIAYQFASNLQQLMSRRTWVKAVGEWEEKLREKYGREPQQNRMKVRPLDIVVDYDIKPHTGTVPGSQDASTWVELFQTLTQAPQIARRFNLQNMFKNIAHHMGAKNVDDFVRNAEEMQPRVMEDQQVEEQVRQGNLVPAQPPNSTQTQGQPTNGQAQPVPPS